MASAVGRGVLELSYLQGFPYFLWPAGKTQGLSHTYLAIGAYCERPTHPFGLPVGTGPPHNIVT